MSLSSVMDYVRSVDTPELQSEIDRLRGSSIDNPLVSQYIAILEKILVFKGSLEMQKHVDHEKGALIDLFLSAPESSSVPSLIAGLSVKDKKSKEKYTPDQRLAVATIITTVAKSHDDILNETTMAKVINNLKDALDLKKLHVKTVYEILGDTSPYDHTDWSHIFDVALLRKLELTNKEGTAEYFEAKNRIAGHRKNVGPKVVGKIDLPVTRKKPEIKQAETTDPLSIVGSSLSNREYLQAYNLDTVEKMREAMQEVRVIPARVINVTNKFVFLTVGSENIGGGNTRLFNVSIPLSAFVKQGKSTEIGQIHPITITSFSPNRYKVGEYFITGFLVDKLHENTSQNLRPTLADAISETDLSALKDRFS